MQTLIYLADVRKTGKIKINKAPYGVFYFVYRMILLFDDLVQCKNGVIKKLDLIRLYQGLIAASTL